jgi:hypothetical protein
MYGDIRVVQRGQQAGFAVEARHAIGIGGECRRKNFQRDLAPQLGIARAI